MPIPLPLCDEPAPDVTLTHLDSLWFQVAGTVCNLTCNHCFISCSPHNHAFEFLSLETVQRYLEESIPLGVKEYYFTGGEPFLNREFVDILLLTLQYGPATVLTNGTVLKDEWLARLKQAADASMFSLEFRVSLDGITAADNDPIRGAGTFERIVDGIRRLVSFGFLPIVTVTRTRDDQEESTLFAGFVKLLRDIGYHRPRVKILPTLRIGAEEVRQRGYGHGEKVTPEMMSGYDAALLLCSNSRIVTNRGVHVCPILVEAPASRLGSNLREALEPFALRYRACYTCYKYGALCYNVASSPAEEAGFP
jgi:MoaA/NifB/PqqE/SkfB family radical SAM enzyme